MPSESIRIVRSDGPTLAGTLELPSGERRGAALFAHCFTCTRHSKAAVAVSRELSDRGIACLRFDFTGLGGSEGAFADTHFSSNVDDLVAAADHLRQAHRAPAILIGHSLGGAAVLAAAHRIAEARCVVTVAAPSDPAHVAGLFKEQVGAIRDKGEAEVTLAGRPFRVRREFLDDIAEQMLMDRVAHLHKALLIFHAPTDGLVGIDNATRIFVAAKHPKSFVSLADADHLLTNRRDSTYVADVIAAWASRYLAAPAAEQAAASGEASRQVVVRETRNGKFQNTVSVGPHHLLADEPAASGGDDTGPGPYDFLLAALGACKSMTMRLYADRKGMPLERATVTLEHSKIYARDCADCETREGMLDRIEVTIGVEGALDAEQRRKVLEIADRCPVHRTLTSEIRIVTRAADQEV